MTLMTRAGIESWFALGQIDGTDRELIKALKDQMHDHVDRTITHQWKFPPVMTANAS